MNTEESKNTRDRGWWLLTLVIVHVVVGIYLVIVPDRILFSLSQIITIAHVGVALLTVPWGVFLFSRHLRRNKKRALKRYSGAFRWVALLHLLLVLGIAVAMFSGIGAMWGGRGTLPAAAFWAAAALGDRARWGLMGLGKLTHQRPWVENLRF